MSLGMPAPGLYPAGMSTVTLPGWIESGLALLYPPVCQLCEAQRAAPEAGFVCARCWAKVRFIRPPFCERCGLPYQGEITSSFQCSNCRDMKLSFSTARSAVTARGVVREAIHRYKYQRALWFEAFLADLLLRESVPVLREEKWDLIVPVPLHPTKQREREFNQAERLAGHLAHAITVPLNTRLVRRAQPTRTQTLLTKKQRAENVQHAFAPGTSARLNGQRVILVDDVLTTGATTSACAAVLRGLGAGEVCVWTVARGI